MLIENVYFEKELVPCISQKLPKPVKALLVDLKCATSQGYKNSGGFYQSFNGDGENTLFHHSRGLPAARFNK